MSLNRTDLVKQMNQATSELLQEKGYISFIDVLIKIGKLKKEDYEAWRNGRVRYLEDVISVNLSKINFMLRTLQQNAKNGNLRGSKTEYMKWGNGPKTKLRFSKYGDPNIEAAYSIHYLKPQKNAQHVNQPDRL